MDISKLTNGLTNLFGKSSLKLQKYSPDILIGVGIVGMVGATVLACKATMKCDEILEEHKEHMEMVDKAKTVAKDHDYTEKDEKLDRIKIKIKTGLKLVNNYMPAIMLGGAAIGCILGGHHIMKKRSVAIIAAYNLIEKGFAEYRERVIEELGLEKDFHFRHGTEEVEETDYEIGKDGKKKKVKRIRQSIDNVTPSIYARLFANEDWNDDGSWEGSKEFSPVHHYNYAFLTQKQNWVNDRLTARGHLFLNQVYEELGFPPTKAGQVVGWKKGVNGKDNFISFGPAVDCVAYEDGDPILLDFNVDGPILDLI